MAPPGSAADADCPGRCAPDGDDLAAAPHERNGVVVAQVGLLRQRLAETSAELVQTRAQLAQCRAAQGRTQHDLAQAEARLARCQAQLAQTQQYDMDDRGLFYYLGTRGRTQPWRNPAEAGWVTVSRSSECKHPAGKASDLTGRQPCSSFTQDLPGSWWRVDLGAGRRFTPTRYTLRHSNVPGYVDFGLRSWRLEGSVDGGATWRTLDEHATGDPRGEIPARVDAAATFAVAPERAFPARLFRVLMTGPSPSGHHHLMLSGLEMYGSLGQQQ
ncbi:putative E3 ubiquitin-protein ligase HECTD1 [Paratrimastix pyriformis]|uniref:E3 ubiquitin-protein ligase HECTD1 n=1 Tax=Paratrimastix pyriformis TaxID=342808 RepID=A0ABQ8UKV3_9EUKA|nr:putative E3 ubiquitin-protein ligase HECTD1 [Paratrimastix pyriformis]